MDYPTSEPQPAGEPVLATPNELAELTGVDIPTLRTYTNAGLLPLYTGQPDEGVYFDVTDALNRLAALAELERQGFSLGQIVDWVGKR